LNLQLCRDHAKQCCWRRFVLCENPARIARVTKSDRKAQSIVVAPMLAHGRQVSASRKARLFWRLTIILALLPDRLSFSQLF
jgi:hypothetical protein